MSPSFSFFAKRKPSSPENPFSFLEQIPVPAFAADTESRAVEANRLFFELFHRDPADPKAILRTWLDEIAETDRAAFEANWKTAATKPSVFRFRLKSDPPRWLEIKTRPPENGKNQLITAVVEEITAQVQLEQQAERDRQMLQAILDSSPDLIFVKDAECRYLIGNRAHVQRVGKRSLSEIVGKTVFDFFSPERAEKAFAAEKKIVENGRPVLNLREDDEGVSYLSHKVPFRNAEGKVAGFVGISRDVTELREIQNALQKAKEEAEAGTRAKSEFLANMSHELRTPMNAVIGMTDLLMETPLTYEQRDFVETIHSSGAALLSIISDILDFSKIESGHTELERRPVDLRNSIEEALDLLSAQASKKSLDLVYLIEEPCPAILLGDEMRLRQILLNLIGNAVKFTQKGEVFVKVKAEPTIGEQHRFLFSVQDTGIGIRKEEMSRLFRSFTQLDASTTREYGGTGLGLAISRRLAKLMGGELWCESEPGAGSTFHFTVVADIAPGERRVFFRSEQPQLEGRSLLIVDDNPANRQILVLQTKSWGMKPTAVASGREALELLENDEMFDLAILDRHMPELDGIALAKKLQENPKTQTLPLVMLTSRATVQKAADEDIRFAAHLTKPVKASHLFNILAEHFARNGNPDEPPLEIPPRESDQPHLRILLAEDNAVNQKVALLTLKKLGHEVEVAANGNEVLAAFERSPFDVILMDVQMPETDGLEATRRLREMYPDPENPWIIAMTANALLEDRERCLAAGMNDYLSKPVKIEALANALAKARTALSPTSPQP